ncbi:MAG: tetratricopeptide repeat protein [Candidatus Omnitrophica bacterium]|nr:tetratricopeptide repeat protein [Candidatus Omnitrophota bacterium]MDD5429764.1 tetratricopeptide repeat protein [Candidatus Omnitrophota bacterium]
MLKKSLKSLPLSLLVLLLVSCSTPPTYSRKDIADVIRNICKNEYGISVSAWSFGNTLWIYAPLNIFNASGEFNTDDKGELNDDLSQNMRNIQQSIVRAFLNMDSPPLFYCFVKSDINQHGVDLYTAAFVPDQMRFILNQEGLNIMVPSGELAEKMIDFSFFNPAALEDSQGSHIQKYDISMDEFIGLLLYQKMLRFFLPLEAKKNVQINNITLDHKNKALQLRFDIIIKEDKKNTPLPLEKALEITKNVMGVYKEYSNITSVIIEDIANNRTETLSFPETKPRTPVGIYDGSEGLETLTKLLQANFYLSMANDNFNQGKNEATVKFCEKALNFYPEYFPALMLSADSYFSSNNFDAALTALGKAEKIFPDNFNLVYSLGRLYAAKNQPQKAIEYFKKAYNFKPDNPVVLHALAVTYAQVGNSKETLRYLDKLKKNNSGEPQTPQFIANIQTSLKNYNEAVSYYKKALEKDPENPQIHISLAETYFFSGNTEEAILHYDEALKFAPDSPYANYGLANVYSSKKLNQEAIELYKKALEASPDDSRIYTEIGFNYIQLADTTKDRAAYSTAITYLEKALRLYPENIRAGYQLGMAYSKINDFKKSLEQFKKLLRLSPNNPDIYYNLGCSYRMLNNPGAALENLKKSKELFLEHGRKKDALEVDKILEQLRFEENTTAAGN